MTDSSVEISVDNVVAKPLEGTDFVFDPVFFPYWSMWKHSNGNLYVITNYSNMPDESGEVREKYPITIVYKNLFTGKQYTRPAHDWYRSMTRVSIQNITIAPIVYPEDTVVPAAEGN